MCVWGGRGFGEAGSKEVVGERCVCVWFIFVEREREREGERERIYNEWGLMRCESPVTVRVCRR